VFDRNYRFVRHTGETIRDVIFKKYKTNSKSHFIADTQEFLVFLVLNHFIKTTIWKSSRSIALSYALSIIFFFQTSFRKLDLFLPLCLRWKVRT